MTLTQAAVLTRRIIMITAVLAVLSIAGAVGYKIWYNHYLSTLPPLEEKPDMKFGNLPELIFPLNDVSSSNFSYSLDTVTGGLPEVPKIMKVYFIPKTKISLLAPQRAQEMAEKLGFPNGPEVVSEIEYKYKDENSNELFLDLTTGNFHFQRPNIASGSSEIKNPLPNQNQLINIFKAYLSSRNLLPEQLETGEGRVVYDQGIAETSDTAMVSLLPDKLDSLPILTAAFKDGLMRAKITQYEEETRKFASLNYIFWFIDKTTFATYSIKSADQAFADLKSGRGFIAIQPNKPQVSISSVYLAYYQTETYTPYLQPIFVFEGPNFAALVPAIGK